MPKIIDCFMFYNELEILKIRLHEVYDVVDHIILVEATTTHTGNPKPLFYTENKDMFKEYNDKIIHLVTDFTPKYHFVESIKNCESWNILGKTEAWYKEHYQRECIQLALKDLNLNDDDLIILTDVDEIPNREVIKNLKNITIYDCIYTLEMTLYYYNIELTITNLWTKAKMFNYKTYKNHKLLTDIREITYGIKILNGGWHLSYFGDVNFIKNKLESIADDDQDPKHKDIKHIQECVDKCLISYNKKQLIHIPLSTNTNTPRFFQKKV